MKAAKDLLKHVEVLLCEKGIQNLLRAMGGKNNGVTVTDIRLTNVSAAFMCAYIIL